MSSPTWLKVDDFILVLCVCVCVCPFVLVCVCVCVCVLTLSYMESGCDENNVQKSQWGTRFTVVLVPRRLEIFDVFIRFVIFSFLKGIHWFARFVSSAKYSSECFQNSHAYTHVFLIILLANYSKPCMHVMKEIYVSSTSKQTMTAKANGEINVTGIQMNKTRSYLLVIWTNKNHVYKMQAKHFGCKQLFGQKQKYRLELRET